MPLGCDRTQWNDDGAARPNAIFGFVPNLQPIARVEDITRRILTVRGQRAMLDSDLAALYGVTTKRLNEQVRRNRVRFPADFAFQLTAEEVANLRSHFATSSSQWGGRRYLPLVFTEHGAVMLANVLNSPGAIQMSVFVVRAFLQLREWVAGQTDLAARLTALERRVGVHDSELIDIIQTIRRMLEPPVEPRKRIGFRPDLPTARPRQKPLRPGG